MKQYVIDSFAMIAFFEDEPGAGEVAEILERLIDRSAAGYICVINWGEIYYSTLRAGGADKAEAVVDQLKKYPIQLVAADRDLTYDAAKLKGKYAIAYADCFAAALSLRKNSPVVTGDPEFEKLENEIRVHWVGV